MIGKTRAEISNVPVLKLQFYDYALKPINPISVKMLNREAGSNFQVTQNETKQPIAYHNTSLIYADWKIEEGGIIAIGQESESTLDITNIKYFSMVSLTKADGTILTKFKNYPQ